MTAIFEWLWKVGEWLSGPIFDFRIFPWQSECLGVVPHSQYVATALARLLLRQAKVAVAILCIGALGPPRQVTEVLSWIDTDSFIWRSHVSLPRRLLRVELASVIVAPLAYATGSPYWLLPIVFAGVLATRGTAASAILGGLALNVALGDSWGLEWLAPGAAGITLTVARTFGASFPRAQSRVVRGVRAIGLQATLKALVIGLLGVRILDSGPPGMDWLLVTVCAFTVGEWAGVVLIPAVAKPSRLLLALRRQFGGKVPQRRSELQVDTVIQVLKGDLFMSSGDHFNNISESIISTRGSIIIGAIRSRNPSVQQEHTHLLNGLNNIRQDIINNTKLNDDVKQGLIDDTDYVKTELERSKPRFERIIETLQNIGRISGAGATTISSLSELVHKIQQSLPPDSPPP